MYRFFSDKNIVIMICRSGRHRSVANAESWPNTLTRCGRRQHSVSLEHYEQVQAECLRRVPVPDLVTGRWKRPRPERAEGPAQSVKDPSSTHFEKASDKCRGYTCQDEHESRNPGRTGRATRKHPRKRPCTGQLSAETRRLPQNRSDYDRSGQVHVSQIAGRGMGRFGSSDATVTRRSLYRNQAEQTTLFAYRNIESESLSSPRGIERTICTSSVNRNAIAAIFSRDTGASYRG